MASFVVGALLLGGRATDFAWCGRSGERFQSGRDVHFGVGDSVVDGVVAEYLLAARTAATSHMVDMDWLAARLFGGLLVLLLNVHGAGFKITPGCVDRTGRSRRILWALGSVSPKRVPLPPSPFMATAAQMITGGIFAPASWRWATRRIAWVSLKSFERREHGVVGRI